jgi:hypothetical protein
MFGVDGELADGGGSAVLSETDGGPIALHAASSRAAARASATYGPGKTIEPPPVVVAGARRVGPGGRRRDRGRAVADVLVRRRPGRLTGHAERRSRYTHRQPCRGRTRLAARDRGSGERRRHRPTPARLGWWLCRCGGGAAGIRTRPAPRSRDPIHGVATGRLPPAAHRTPTIAPSTSRRTTPRTGKNQP